MTTTIPAGVRLDSWPRADETLEDSPEVALLREELRRALPQLAIVLEMLAKLRPALDLSGQLAGPQPAKLKMHRS